MGNGGGGSNPDSPARSQRRLGGVRIVDAADAEHAADKSPETTRKLKIAQLPLATANGGHEGNVTPGGGSTHRSAGARSGWSTARGVLATARSGAFTARSAGLRALRQIRSLIPSLALDLPSGPTIEEQGHAMPLPLCRHYVTAATIFADVSGFSRMSDRLSRLSENDAAAPPRPSSATLEGAPAAPAAGAEAEARGANPSASVGVEVLAQILQASPPNAHPQVLLERLTQAIIDQGGDVIKYAGDSVIAVFVPRETDGREDPFGGVEAAVGNALRAACALQRAVLDVCRSFAVLELDLRIRVGIGVGPVSGVTVGAPARREYFICGAGLSQALEGEHLAPPGHAALSPSALAALPPGIAAAVAALRPTPAGQVTPPTSSGGVLNGGGAGDASGAPRRANWKSSIRSWFGGGRKSGSAPASSASVSPAPPEEAGTPQPQPQPPASGSERHSIGPDGYCIVELAGLVGAEALGASSAADLAASLDAGSTHGGTLFGAQSPAPTARSAALTEEPGAGEEAGGRPASRGGAHLAHSPSVASSLGAGMGQRKGSRTLMERLRGAPAAPGLKEGRSGSRQVLSLQTEEEEVLATVHPTSKPGLSTLLEAIQGPGPGPGAAGSPAQNGPRSTRSGSAAGGGCSTKDFNKDFKELQLGAFLTAPPAPLHSVETDSLDLSSPAVADYLRSFVPRPVAAKLEAGGAGATRAFVAEMRRMTVLFICFPGELLRPGPDGAPLPDSLADLSAVVRTLQEAMDAFEGSIRQVCFDDKGLVLIAAFGLPLQAHEDDELRGLNAALYMCRQVPRRVGEGSAWRPHCGVATGPAFAGFVGSKSRCEYMVVGDSVVVSARLMALALERGEPCLCDERTRAKAAEAGAGAGGGTRLAFDELPEPVLLKGKSTPVRVFRASNRGGGRGRDEDGGSAGVGGGRGSLPVSRAGSVVSLHSASPPPGSADESSPVPGNPSQTSIPSLRIRLPAQPPIHSTDPPVRLGGRRVRGPPDLDVDGGGGLTARGAVRRARATEEEAGAPPLVGRQREMAVFARLANGLAGAAPRSAHLELEGAAGVGKSRLLLAMRAAAPPTALWAACSAGPVERLRPYRALRGLFHTLLGAEPLPARNARVEAALASRPDLLPLRPLLSGVLPVRFPPSAAAGGMDEGARSAALRSLLVHLVATLDPTVPPEGPGHNFVPSPSARQSVVFLGGAGGAIASASSLAGGSPHLLLPPASISSLPPALPAALPPAVDVDGLLASVPPLAVSGPDLRARRHVPSLTPLRVALPLPVPTASPPSPGGAWSARRAFPEGRRPCPLIISIDDAQHLDSASWALLASLDYAARPTLLLVSGRPFGDGSGPYGPASGHGIASNGSANGARTARLSSFGARQDFSFRGDGAGAGVPPELIRIRRNVTMLHEQMRLPPLPKEATAALLSALALGPQAAQAAVPPPAVDFVYERSGGNPLWATELFYQLLADGVLAIRQTLLPAPQGPDGALPGPVVTAVDNFNERARSAAIPQRLNNLLISRMDRLPPRHSLMLKVAAGLGHRFSRLALIAVFRAVTEGAAALRLPGRGEGKAGGDGEEEGEGEGGDEEEATHPAEALGMIELLVEEGLLEEEDEEEEEEDEDEDEEKEGEGAGDGPLPPAEDALSDERPPAGPAGPAQQNGDLGRAASGGRRGGPLPPSALKPSTPSQRAGPGPAPAPAISPPPEPVQLPSGPPSPPPKPAASVPHPRALPPLPSQQPSPPQPPSRVPASPPLPPGGGTSPPKAPPPLLDPQSASSSLRRLVAAKQSLPGSPSSPSLRPAPPHTLPRSPTNPHPLEHPRSGPLPHGASFKSTNRSGRSNGSGGGASAGGGPSALLLPRSASSGAGAGEGRVLPRSASQIAAHAALGIVRHLPHSGSSRESLLSRPPSSPPGPPARLAFSNLLGELGRDRQAGKAEAEAEAAAAAEPHADSPSEQSGGSGRPQVRIETVHEEEEEAEKGHTDGEATGDEGPSPGSDGHHADDEEEGYENEDEGPPEWEREAHYRFTHSLAKDAAYGTLTSEQKQAVHAAAALYFESVAKAEAEGSPNEGGAGSGAAAGGTKRGAQRAADAKSLLVHHFTRAGPAHRPRAIQYMEEAAGEALGQGARVEALQMYRRLVALASEGSGAGDHAIEIAALETAAAGVGAGSFRGLRTRIAAALGTHHQRRRSSSLMSLGSGPGALGLAPARLAAWCRRVAELEAAEGRPASSARYAARALAVGGEAALRADPGPAVRLAQAARHLFRRFGLRPTGLGTLLRAARRRSASSSFPFPAGEGPRPAGRPRPTSRRRRRRRRCRPPPSRCWRWRGRTACSRRQRSCAGGGGRLAGRAARPRARRVAGGRALPGPPLCPPRARPLLRGGRRRRAPLRAQGRGPPPHAARRDAAGRGGRAAAATAAARAELAAALAWAASVDVGVDAEADALRWARQALALLGAREEEGAPGALGTAAAPWAIGARAVQAEFLVLARSGRLREAASAVDGFLSSLRLSGAGGGAAVGAPAADGDGGTARGSGGATRPARAGRRAPRRWAPAAPRGLHFDDVAVRGGARRLQRDGERGGPVGRAAVLGLLAAARHGTAEQAAQSTGVPSDAGRQRRAAAAMAEVAAALVEAAARGAAWAAAIAGEEADSPGAAGARVPAGVTPSTLLGLHSAFDVLLRELGAEREAGGAGAGAADARLRPAGASGEGMGPLAAAEAIAAAVEAGARGNPLMRPMSLSMAGRLAAARGERGPALRLLRAGRAEAARRKQPLVEGFARLRSAELLASRGTGGALRRARADAVEAERLFQLCACKYGLSLLRSLPAPLAPQLAL
eukprot:tig00000385_g24751.t1